MKLVEPPGKSKPEKWGHKEHSVLYLTYKQFEQVSSCKSGLYRLVCWFDTNN